MICLLCRLSPNPANCVFLCFFPSVYPWIGVGGGSFSTISPILSHWRPPTYKPLFYSHTKAGYVRLCNSLVILSRSCSGSLQTALPHTNACTPPSHCSDVSKQWMGTFFSAPAIYLTPGWLLRREAKLWAVMFVTGWRPRSLLGLQNSFSVVWFHVRGWIEYTWCVCDAVCKCLMKCQTAAFQKGEFEDNKTDCLCWVFLSLLLLELSLKWSRKHFWHAAPPWHQIFIFFQVIFTSLQT